MPLGSFSTEVFNPLDQFGNPILPDQPGVRLHEINVKIAQIAANYIIGERRAGRISEEEANRMTNILRSKLVEVGALPRYYSYDPIVDDKADDPLPPLPIERQDAATNEETATAGRFLGWIRELKAMPIEERLGKIKQNERYKGMKDEIALAQAYADRMEEGIKQEAWKINPDLIKSDKERKLLMFIKKIGKMKAEKKLIGWLDEMREREGYSKIVRDDVLLAQICADVMTKVME